MEFKTVSVHSIMEHGSPRKIEVCRPADVLANLRSNTLRREGEKGGFTEGLDQMISNYQDAVSHPLDTVFSDWGTMFTPTEAMMITFEADGRCVWVTQDRECNGEEWWVPREAACLCGQGHTGADRAWTASISGEYITDHVEIRKMCGRNLYRLKRYDDDGFVRYTFPAPPSEPADEAEIIRALLNWFPLPPRNLDRTGTVEDGECGMYGHDHYKPCPWCGDVHRTETSCLDPHLHRFTGEDNGMTQECRSCGRVLRYIPRGTK